MRLSRGILAEASISFMCGTWYSVHRTHTYNVYGNAYAYSTLSPSIRMMASLRNSYTSWNTDLWFHSHSHRINCSYLYRRHNFSFDKNNSKTRCRNGMCWFIACSCIVCAVFLFTCALALNKHFYAFFFNATLFFLFGFHFKHRRLKFRWQLNGEKNKRIKASM